MTPSAAPDAFLGLLSLAEGYRLYGMVSNTHTRVLMATKEGTEREEDAKAVREKGSAWPTDPPRLLTPVVFLRSRFWSGYTGHIAMLRATPSTTAARP